MGYEEEIAQLKVELESKKDKIRELSDVMNAITSEKQAVMAGQLNLLRIQLEDVNKQCVHLMADLTAANLELEMR